MEAPGTFRARIAEPWSLGLAGLLLLLYFGGLGAVPLFEPDEGRYTEIPREMLAAGEFVLPHLNGVLYFEKPPLPYWLTASAMALFGPGPFATRFWNALLALAGLGLAAWLCGRLGGPRAGLLAALALGTSPLYLAMAHVATLDMSVSVFITLSLACFWFFQAAEENAPRRRLYAWGMFGGAALAVLCKGLIGMAVPGAVIGLFILISGRWGLLRKVPWLSGALLFLAVAAPWHVLAALRNPEFLKIYFVREHFLRYLTPVSDRQEPWWFFLPVLAAGFLPWTGLLHASAGLLPRPLRLLRRSRADLLFLLLWAGFIFLFFSASESKLVPYMLPALPPLAILAALGLDRLWGQGGRLPRTVRATGALGGLLWTGAGAAFLWAGLGRVAAFSAPDERFPLLAGLGSLLAAVSALGAAACLAGRVRPAVLLFTLSGACFFGGLWAAAPQAGIGRNVEPFAAYLKAHMKPGDELYSYRCYPQTLPVYLERPIGVVAFWGELTFGVSQLPEEERRRRFPHPEEFKPLWDSDRRVYVVTDRESLPLMEREGLGHATLLMGRRIVVLLTNKPPGPDDVSR